MIGIAVLYLAAIAVGSLGVGMLRFPQFWIDFFRQSRTRTGAAVNRRLVTLSTLRFQACMLLLFSVVLIVVMTTSLVDAVGGAPHG